MRRYVGIHDAARAPCWLGAGMTSRRLEWHGMQAPQSLTPGRPPETLAASDSGESGDTGQPGGRRRRASAEDTGPDPACDVDGDGFV